MECTVEMKSQQEFSKFSRMLDYNLRMKLGYEYSMNHLTQSKFPAWTLGSSEHLAFQQRDEEGKVYHCRIKVNYSCREIVLNQFKINKEVTVVYGISDTHPDTIKFQIEDLCNYLDEFDTTTLKEVAELADFGTTKAVKKTIKEFEEWKLKEWMNSIEYLLKEEN
jgi:hypothetical protein